MLNYRRRQGSNASVLLGTPRPVGQYIEAVAVDDGVAMGGHGLVFFGLGLGLGLGLAAAAATLPVGETGGSKGAGEGVHPPVGPPLGGSAQAQRERPGDSKHPTKPEDRRTLYRRITTAAVEFLRAPDARRARERHRTPRRGRRPLPRRPQGTNPTSRSRRSETRWAIRSSKR
jgi:hypothetical protein